MKALVKCRWIVDIKGTGVDLTGSIVIVRYGGIFRGLKAHIYFQIFFFQPRLIS